MTTALAPRPQTPALRKPARGRQKYAKTVRRLPEYLEPPQVQALIHLAPHAQARLLMLTQWRAGLRVSEALAVEVADLNFSPDNPTLESPGARGARPE